MIWEYFMTQNTGTDRMRRILKKRIMDMVDMDMTTEAEDMFYDAVVDYTRRLAEESIEISGHTRTKTLKREDVEIA